MSSLAASRADNFYFPPDFDPKQGSLNAQQGTHALGKRAKHIDKGIIIVRFEAPFPIWCSGCNFKISKGCRFNAEKKAVGTYHSSKIWSFHMITPCCANELEIHTDPKACEYLVVKGGQRKVEEYSAADAETVELRSRQEVEAERADPFKVLERGGEDRRAAADAKPRLEQLQDMGDARSDSYSLNKALRRQHRTQRKEAAATLAEGRAVGLPDHIQLLPPSATDAATAAAVFGGAASAAAAASCPFEAMRKLSRCAIRASSIFSSPAERALPRGALLARTAGGTGRSRAQPPPPPSSTPSSTQKRIALLAKRQRML